MNFLKLFSRAVTLNRSEFKIRMRKFKIKLATSTGKYILMEAAICIPNQTLN